MYVRMYFAVCMYVWMYVCVYVCMYVCMSCLYVCMYVCPVCPVCGWGGLCSWITFRLRRSSDLVSCCYQDRSLRFIFRTWQRLALWFVWAYIALAVRAVICGRLRGLSPSANTCGKRDLRVHRCCQVFVEGEGPLSLCEKSEYSFLLVCILCV